MNDDHFMKQAVALALKARGFTSPNPLVGAVVVRNGKIIGRGYHKKAGEDHAEVAAFKDALKKKNAVKGSTLYVNLEPCSHFGATPPCVEEIVEMGVKKVCFSHIDPSKKVNGKGARFLRKNGVEVKNGVLENEARLVNQPFLKMAKSGMPYVTLKAGMSLDGKIATKKGSSKWITSGASREHARSLRVSYDAIVVGAGTVIADNPRLNMGGGKSLRVIVDGKLRSSLKSRVFCDENVFVAYSGLASAGNVEAFEGANVKMKSFGKNKVDVKKMLAYLAKEFGIQSVFVEGGGEVHGSFVDASLVDDIYFYIAPKIIGGEDAVDVVKGGGVSNLKDVLKFKKTDVSKLKDDILIHGIVNEY
ncbi:bifunctional diaminohydroxyphosphoribosylaminopyrimidine deaminase/5-amino-6-(5-phosphoribosylamino)uracil reductase RibD [Candidatus Peregrinibacteria bacterium]|jgi:diaminohydroxyphosphoribosylaminopyrimidine deaminase / 5-amino-6-(5-phosphoribosylamino)uracil reductase|nr:bifunctional diaminohydroxyphosphoribosylaminopyrimidine deaminase/5-amino-6-(5-phosphoribosylamino)uracil reductase RibD [Candidatus Peregrinibacteria bacterium]MBT4055705.1 bifunctional diaminohydroxyphosphoribosylaminopyrimidine deaminase/5-amino-6-(5-phosphoribosylamino)uracil reductase RibD [Candidatus Peregrinibacteria bacterium]